MQVFIAVFVIVAVIAVTLLIISNRFGGDVRTLRRDLTAERQRSSIAQRALREIAAGAEYAIFVADNALDAIEKTHSNNKEIA